MVSEKEREEIELAELAAIDPTGGLDDLLIFGSRETRRHFLKQMAGTSAALGLGPGLMGIRSAGAAETTAGATVATAKVQLKINGQEYALELDPRTTLLDALREH